MAQVSATIGIQNSGFKRGLDELRQHAAQWKDDLKGTLAGAFTLGAALNWFNDFRQQMGRVKDLADRLGQSTTVIQQVGNVAKTSGTDLERVTAVLTQLTLAAAKGDERFAALGIRVEDFANAGHDQQLLMLAAAYEQANGDQAKMIELMDLLGGKGQDILPMLSQGVQGLADSFAAVPTVAEGAVAAVANFNNAIDTLILKSQQAAGSVVGLMQAGGRLAAAWFTKGADSEKMWADFADRMTQDQTPTGVRNPAAPEAAKGAEDTAKKRAAGVAALNEEIQRLARSRMSDEQKITDMQKEQEALRATVQNGSLPEEQRLEAAKKLLEVQRAIEELQTRAAKTAADEKEKRVQKAQKAAEEAAKAENALAEEKKRQELAAMDPKARLAALKKDQKALEDEAAAAAGKGDRTTAAQKSLEALKLNEDIAAAQKALESPAKAADASKPGIVSSSLAAIGGGGGVYAAQGINPALQEARSQTNLLRQIAQNTARGSAPGGPADIASRNPF